MERGKTMRKVLMIGLVLMAVISGNTLAQTLPVAESFQMPFDGSPEQPCEFGLYGMCLYSDQYHLAEDHGMVAADPVYACADGIVRQSRNSVDQYGVGYGGLIIIEHELVSGERVVSICAHLDNSTSLVSVDDEVSAGQLIGFIGAYEVNGHMSEHLHFGIHRGEYDPGLACDGEWNYQGYSPDTCVLTDWYDPSDFVAGHLQIGHFTDGWHTDGISQQFLDAFKNFSDGPSLGVPWDNDHDPNNPDGIFVHEFFGMYIQDFEGYNNGLIHPNSALIKSPDGTDNVYLLKEGFWLQWMFNCGWENYGYPTSNEEEWTNPDDSQLYMRQNFSNKYFIWLIDSTDDVIVFNLDGTLSEEASACFQNGTGGKTVGDGIYQTGQFITDFDQPIQLTQYQTFSGFYAMISGTQYDIDQFTVVGDMTIVVGDETVPDPCIVGFLDTGVNDIFVSGNHAYVANRWGGVKVINISDPSNPNMVGFVDTYKAMGIFVSGNHAYVADNNSGLKVINISDSSNPVIVGSVDTNAASKVFVSGNYAYVADAYMPGLVAGLRIINISDPSNPVIVGSVDTNDAYDIFVSGNHAYVADGSSGLKVINISDPSNPVIVGFLDISVFGIFVSGNHAYVTTGTSGIKVINISDPSNPVIVGSVDTFRAKDIFVSGDYAYLADGGSGIKVINISDPSNPIIMSSVDTRNAVGIFVSGNYAYVADADWGFHVLQKNCGTTAAVSSNFVGNSIGGVVDFDVNFFDYSTGYPTTWAWDFGDGNTSDVQNPVHTYSMHGTFDVSLTVDNGTSADTKTITEMIVATRPPIPEDPLYPHNEPNPFNPITIISYKLDKAQNVKLEIFDLRGRRIATLVDKVMDKGVHRARFDGHSYASGVYFYRLTDSSGSQAHKILLLK